MRTLILISIIMTFTLSANAQIYKWRDANGKLNFSDTPPATGETAAAINITPNQAIGTPQKERATEGYSQTTTTVSRPLRAPVKTSHHISAADYSIDKRVDQKRDGTVIISGRISNGPDCENLRVDAWARSSDGGIVSITDMTSLKGAKSTLFEGTDHYRKYLKEWFISSFYVTCQD